jgi:hypothetical protein
VTYVYVADTGNRPAHRSTVVIYRVPEPEVAAGAAAGTSQLSGVVALSFSYPPGPVPDVETLLVDPVTGELFVVTKAPERSRILRANGTTFEPVGEVPTPVLTQWFTGGDVTPDGRFVALRADDVLAGDGSVVIFPRPEGAGLAAAFAQPPCAGAVGAEAMGEAIGFTPDGLGYVTASEGGHPALHRFHTP